MFLRRGVCDLSWAVLLVLLANGLPCGGEWHFLLAVARSRGGGIARIRFSAFCLFWHGAAMCCWRYHLFWAGVRVLSSCLSFRDPGLFITFVVRLCLFVGYFLLSGAFLVTM